MTLNVVFTSTRVLDFIGDSEKQFQSKDESGRLNHTGSRENWRKNRCWRGKPRVLFWTGLK